MSTNDLYRFYDDEDRLLYIGISIHAALRSSQHRKEKAWWAEVVRMEVEHLRCTRDEMERIETMAIRAERPLYNVAKVERAAMPTTVEMPREKPSQRHLSAAQLLYSPDDLVVVLRMARGRIYELLASGEIPSLKIGRSRRVTADALRAYVDGRAA